MDDDEERMIVPSQPLRSLRQLRSSPTFRNTSNDVLEISENSRNARRSMSSKYGDINSPNSRLPGRSGRDDPQQRGNQQNIPPPKNEEELENAAEKALKSMETTHRQMLVLRQKVIVVGEYASGKTALVNMFTSGGHNFPNGFTGSSGAALSLAAQL